MTIVIKGNWRKGIAYDLHSFRSVYLGVDENGNDRWETTRSQMGDLLYQLKYQSDRTAIGKIVDLLAKYEKLGPEKTMTTVFISGSRNITRLNRQIRDRLRNVVDQNFAIIVGDADGADKALQKHLSDMGYDNVVVYCSGRSCRNNIGNWKVKHIAVAPGIKGRAFYTQKDKEMAAAADYGFVLWDGKSPGSLNNIMELLRKNKKTLVYFSPDRTFYPVSELADAQHLLSKCTRSSVENISKKIRLNATMREIESMAQGLPMMDSFS